MYDTRLYTTTESCTYSASRGYTHFGFNAQLTQHAAGDDAQKMISIPAVRPSGKDAG